MESLPVTAATVTVPIAAPWWQKPRPQLQLRGGVLTIRDVRSLGAPIVTAVTNVAEVSRASARTGTSAALALSDDHNAILLSFQRPVAARRKHPDRVEVQQEVHAVLFQPLIQSAVAVLVAELPENVRVEPGLVDDLTSSRLPFAALSQLRRAGVFLFVASVVTAATSVLESVPDLVAVGGLVGMLVGRGLMWLSR